MHSTQVELDQRLNELQTVTSPAEIVGATLAAGQVLVDPKLVEYINAVVRQTRNWPQFYMGASPRAGLALMQGARTLGRLPRPRPMRYPTTFGSWPARSAPPRDCFRGG